MIEGRHYAARQSRGARNYQEDEFGFLSLSAEADDRPHDLLAVLADGMGGHKGGAHASAVAVTAFLDAFQAAKVSTRERLRVALDQANERVGVDSRGDPSLEGMGCTLVGAVFTEQGLQWISVGDSPFWLFRAGKLIRLNADHSMAPLLAEQVEQGLISAAEAARHPQRNALRSAVVGEALALIDLKDPPMPIEPGDRFVLASDGLETLSEEEIGALLSEMDGNPEKSAEGLLAAVEAKARKGQDNTTVIIVDPFAPPAMAGENVETNAAAEAEPGTIIPASARRRPARSRGGTAILGLLALLIVLGLGYAWQRDLLPMSWLRAEPASAPASAPDGAASGGSATNGQSDDGAPLAPGSNGGAGGTGQER